MSSIMSDPAIQQELEALYEKEFWAPATTKKQLKQWILTFLQIDLPDQVVDLDNSTSCPMDFIWDVYSAALTGDPKRTQFVVAAARATFKTLSAAIIEFLMMVHFGRDLTHLAAIEEQSKAGIGYLNQFLAIPLVQKYAKTNNTRTKQILGTPRNPYKPKGNAKVKVIVATLQSANAQRASCLVFDEVDLIDRAILSEAAFIAEPDRSGKPPIFIYLSSRKSSSGPVQDLIDKAQLPGSTVRLHKWSLLDFMKKCPDSIHRPDLPKIDVYLDPDTLEYKSEAEYSILASNQQAIFEPLNVFAGCQACPAFIVCQGRSPAQNGNAPALRDIAFVGALVGTVADPDKINAQLLNLKPESGGTVYNRFSRQLHKKNTASMWEFAFGTPPVDSYGQPFLPSKADLIQELRVTGWALNCGVDFGYVDPAYAVLTAYQRSSAKLLVLHCATATGKEDQEWLMYVKETIFDVYGFDLVCPDTARKAAPSISARLGMPSRDKKPNRIETGVSFVRNLLWNTKQQTSRFAVLDDPSTLEIMKDMESWQYLKTPTGFNSTQFSDGDYTHSLDALRYAIDPFILGGAGILAASQIQVSRPGPSQAAADLKSVIHDHIFQEYGINLQEKEDNSKSDSLGGIIFSF